MRDIYIDFDDKKKNGKSINFGERGVLSQICALGWPGAFDCLKNKSSYVRQPMSEIDIIQCCESCEHCMKRISVVPKWDTIEYLHGVFAGINEKWLIQPSLAKCWVYWISDGEYQKIGKACSVNGRMREMQTGQARELSVLGVIPCKSERYASHLENYFHHSFKSYHIRGEWFRIPYIASIHRAFLDIEENQRLDDLAGEDLKHEMSGCIADYLYGDKTREVRSNITVA